MKIFTVINNGSFLVLDGQQLAVLCSFFILLPRIPRSSVFLASAAAPPWSMFLLTSHPRVQDSTLLWLCLVIATSFRASYFHLLLRCIHVFFNSHFKYYITQNQTRVHADHTHTFQFPCSLPFLLASEHVLLGLPSSEAWLHWSHHQGVVSLMGSWFPPPPQTPGLLLPGAPLASHVAILRGQSSVLILHGLATYLIIAGKYMIQGSSLSLVLPPP